MLDEALKYDLLIFDCDGTIRQSASGRVVPSSPDDVAIIPQAQEFFNRLGTYRKRPRVALCSNQMGVGQRYAAEVWLADGLLPKNEGFEKWCREMVATRPTEAEMEAVMQATADAVGADEWAMCCYWPPSVDGKERPRPENPYSHQADVLFMDYMAHEGRWSGAWRKPATGMLQWLRAGAQRTPVEVDVSQRVSGHGSPLPLSVRTLKRIRRGIEKFASPSPRTLMVGNGDEDKEAAEKVECDYMDAAVFWEIVSA